MSNDMENKNEREMEEEKIAKTAGQDNAENETAVQAENGGTKENETAIQKEDGDTKENETAIQKENRADKRKQRSGKIKKSFSSQQFKSGAYSTFLTVLVVALVIIVNLVFHKLDLSTDLSSGSLFTLSKETKDLADKIDENVTIYYMVQKGQEMDYIQRVVEQYKKLSDHVKVVTKDPVVYPAFSKQFVEDEISDNDVIVVNETTKAARYISSDEMIYTESYYSYGDGQQYLDVEGRVTSAIQYVLSSDVKKVYMVTGHGEQEFSDSLQVSLEKMNMDVESLALLTEGEVPSDCDVLCFYGTMKDLEDGEKEAVLKYLKEGGSALILPIYTTEEINNLEEILDYYGVGLQKGVIYEGAGHYYNYTNYIVPSVNTQTEIMSQLDSDEYVVMNFAQGLTMAKESSLRSTVTLSDLLSTSEQSLLKVNVESETTEKEKGDLEGPFYTGVYVEETLEEDDTTKIAIYSTAMVPDSLLKSSISTLVGSQTEDGGGAVAIEAKNLSYSSVTMSIGSQIFWAVFLIIIVPAGLLIAGFGIWFVRRRK